MSNTYPEIIGIGSTVYDTLMPVLKTVTLTSIITNFQMFVLFFTMTGGGPVRATTTLTIYTYETAFISFSLATSTSKS